MLLELDLGSSVPLYQQIKEAIIGMIAKGQLGQGDMLPSVRQLAEQIGVNMHTVNKAYAVLRQEGFVKLDRRRGAIVSLDVNKLEALEEMRQELAVVLARGACKNVSRREVHDLVDELFDRFGGNAE